LVLVTKVETISCLFCTAWLIFSSTSLMDLLAWRNHIIPLNNCDQLNCFFDQPHVFPWQPIASSQSLLQRAEDELVLKQWVVKGGDRLLVLLR
jgi:hypothetical protein